MFTGVLGALHYLEQDCQFYIETKDSAAHNDLLNSHSDRSPTEDDDSHHPVVGELVSYSEADHRSPSVRECSKVLGCPSAAGRIELVRLVEQLDRSGGSGVIFQPNVKNTS